MLEWKPLFYPGYSNSEGKLKNSLSKWVIQVIRVHFSENVIKEKENNLVRVSGEFELSEFELLKLCCN